MENDNALSLIDHCKTCKTSCCNDGIMITTEKNHDDIIASGAKDYFSKVAIPAGNFYILDFQSTSCRYLDKIGRCTIEKTKPFGCRTYPIVPTKYSYDLAKSCPAVTALNGTEAFELYIIEARNLIEKQKLETPYDNFCDAFEAFTNRDDEAFLKKMQAKITPAPEAF